MTGRLVALMVLDSGFGRVINLTRPDLPVTMARTGVTVALALAGGGLGIQWGMGGVRRKFH